MIAHRSDHAPALEVLEIAVDSDRILDLRDEDACRFAEIDIKDAIAPWQDLIAQGLRPTRWTRPRLAWMPWRRTPLASPNTALAHEACHAMDGIGAIGVLAPSVAPGRGRLNAADWAQLDPGNGVPWPYARARATRSGDEAARREAIGRPGGLVPIRNAPVCRRGGRCAIEDAG